MRRLLVAAAAFNLVAGSATAAYYLPLAATMVEGSDFGLDFTFQVIEATSTPPIPSQGINNSVATSFPAFTDNLWPDLFPNNKRDVFGFDANRIAYGGDFYGAPIVISNPQHLLALESESANGPPSGAFETESNSGQIGNGFINRLADLHAKLITKLREEMELRELDLRS